MTEKSKRLKPTTKVLRELFMRSGNVCAMPGCDHVIIDNKGVMVGKICHIEAVSDLGPRFNIDMTNEERRQYGPSDYMLWADILAYCKASDTLLEKFVIDLKFGLLG